MATKPSGLMRKDFTCELILNDFNLLQELVENSDEHDFHSKFMTPREILTEKEAIIQELKLDTVFKLLTKLEADIRQDYNKTIRSKRKDALSLAYRYLCKNFIKRIKEYDKHPEEVCKRIRFEEILDSMKNHFENEQIEKNCSLLKGYFKNIRDWYAHGRYFKHFAPKNIPEPKEIKIIYDEFEIKVFQRKKIM